MEYKFAATLKKLALSTAKVKDPDGERGDPAVEVPRVTITLELTDSEALNARLSGYQGSELVILVDGQNHQLNLT